jgi:hypothetical protein
VFAHPRARLFTLAVLLATLWIVPPVQAAPGPKVDVTIGFFTQDLCTSVYVKADWGAPIAGQQYIHFTMREAGSFTQDFPYALASTETFKYASAWVFYPPYGTDWHHYSAHVEIFGAGDVLLAKGRGEARLKCDFLFSI